MDPSKCLASTAMPRLSSRLAAGSPWHVRQSSLDGGFGAACPAAAGAASSQTAAMRVVIRIDITILSHQSPEAQTFSSDGVPRYFFLSEAMYATNVSRSSFGSEYDFISGLRVDFVFSVIVFASVIHLRISSGDSLLPTASSGPFLLPLSPIK